MRILIKAPFSPYSGYGSDGIGMAMALLAKGHDLYLQPTHVDPPLPKELAALLVKRLDPPFDLAINHVDPGQLDCSAGMREASDFVVGWTMWEYTTLDNHPQRKTMRKRYRDFDAVVGYDDVSVGALKPYLGDVPGIVQQGGYEPGEWREMERDWFSDRFGFCMQGALHDRKDPFVAIEAFRELKLDAPEEFDGAELHLKTVVPGLHPLMEQWTPKLRIHYDTWPLDVLQAFYSKQHVLLAPSRGEGKNLPALQMLSSGGTVIATNWGGHQQWLSSEYAYPLNYELRQEGKWPNCLSARASKDHLKELMWHVYTHRDEAKRKGELAAQTIPGMCSWDSVIDRLFLKLRQVPKTGERLYQLSQMTRAA